MDIKDIQIIQHGDDYYINVTLICNELGINNKELTDHPVVGDLIVMDLIPGQIFLQLKYVFGWLFSVEKSLHLYNQLYEFIINIDPKVIEGLINHARNVKVGIQKKELFNM